MANGVYKITEDFEKALSDYTGAPYVITVDNQSNALFLSLYYENNVKKSIKTEKIKIPSLFDKFETFKHSDNEVFQPSSFILAVISDTLSNGQ